MKQAADSGYYAARSLSLGRKPDDLMRMLKNGVFLITKLFKWQKTNL
jgi:hypothetical protein